jgi:hypothetical protein
MLPSLHRFTTVTEFRRLLLVLLNCNEIGNIPLPDMEVPAPVICFWIDSSAYPRGGTLKGSMTMD